MFIVRLCTTRLHVYYEGTVVCYSCQRSRLIVEIHFVIGDHTFIFLTALPNGTSFSMTAKFSNVLYSNLKYLNIRFPLYAQNVMK